MTNQTKVRRVDVEELRELGFPEDLIQEAVLRERKGLLTVEPPADLVNRTIEACSDLFSKEEGSAESSPKEPRADYFSIVFQLVPAVGMQDISLAFRAAASAVQCQTLGEWPRRLADSLRFALSEHQRPLVLLDNHNRTSPLCWEDDSEFQNIKMAVHRVNDFVSSTGIERSITLVVLRPSVSDYRPDEIDALADLMREATSDVWWVPSSKGAKYAEEGDLVVIGNEEVLKLRQGPFEHSKDVALASRLRCDITKEIIYATPIKLHGKLQPSVIDALHQPQGIKLVMETIIEEHATTLCQRNLTCTDGE